MKVQFNYEEWLKDQDRKVVNENDDEVYFYDKDGGGHVVLLHGKAYDPNHAPIWFWVDDPSDKSVKNTEVSDYAKEFIKYASTNELNAVIRCSNWFISKAGIFGHYEFFTKELWRKVDGFKKADKAEVIAAFLHWWMRYEYGIQNHTVGIAWGSNYPTTYKDDDECFNNYIKEYMPVFEAYSEWCYNRR